MGVFLSCRSFCGCLVLFYVGVFICEFTKDDRVFIVRVFCLPSLRYKSSVFDIASNVGYFKTCLRYLISRPRLLGRHEK